MYRAIYALLLLLLAGCAGIDSGSSEGSSEGSEDPPPADETGGETTSEDTTAESPPAARELDSGSFGQGTTRPEVRIASSAAVLAEEFGEEVEDRGEGAYIVALWGRKNTGGYSLNLAGAREKGGRLVIRLLLKEPPEDAMVTQAITYPYVFIFVPDAAPENVRFTDEEGRELDWPVVRAGG
jgi:hypothetical protein